MPPRGPGSTRKKVRQVRKGPSPANNARSWTTAASASRIGVTTHDAALTSSRNSRPPIRHADPRGGEEQVDHRLGQPRPEHERGQQQQGGRDRERDPGAEGVHRAPAYAGRHGPRQDGTAVSEPERLAHRSLRVSLLCFVAIPVLVVALTVLPEGWRGAAFVLGLAAVAAVSIWAGLLGRRVLAGSEPTWRAAAGAWIGLTLGVTAALFTLWTILGIAFG